MRRNLKNNVQELFSKREITTEVLHLNKEERKIWARNEWKIVLM